MNTLKLIGATLVQGLKQAWALPQTISNAGKRRHQRAMINELETERLDRIRNPSKYVGK